jgi:signal transduction histidine kinase
VDRYRSTAAERGITLVLEGEAARVQGHGTSWSARSRNLVDNAVKYTGGPAR